MAWLATIALVLTQIFVGIESCERPRGSDSVCYDVPNLMTTSYGVPVDSMTASLTAGCQGPVLLQDTSFIDELAHFNREKIPDRIAHAVGSGAFGYFEVTNDYITNFSKASLFQKVGKKTPIAIRFSTSGPHAGTCQTMRGSRGAAVKFYTDDGNWDLVGSSFFAFAIRDARLVVSLTHAFRRQPDTNYLNATKTWDWLTLRPESIHQMMQTFSEIGIPDGYRYMDFYGLHAFKLVNECGQPVYCKWHVKSNQGVRNLNSTAAAQKCATDPDYPTRDLFTAIAAGDYPSWTMYFQVMTFEEAELFQWNPFDATKVWPESQFSLHEIGQIVLNKNPINYFAEVEQLAFSPGNLVVGIEPSPDKVLQVRMFSYPDTQRYRLGVNYPQLPVNRPKVPVANLQRDGKASFFNQGNSTNYFPNSDGDNICPNAAWSKWPVYGDVERCNTDGEDDFSQPRSFWNDLNKEGQEALVSNAAASIGNASPEMQIRAVRLFTKVSPDLGEAIASKLGDTTTSSSFTPWNNYIMWH